MDVNIIVLAGFSLFMIMSLRFGYRKAIHGLDEKINEIRQTLNKAETSRQNALDFLQAERQRHADIIRTVEESLQQKQTELHELRVRMAHEIDDLLASRQHNADMVFDKIRIEMIQDMKEKVTEATLKVMQNLATDHMDKNQHQHLNDIAIEQIAQMLHPHKPANGSTETEKNLKSAAG